MKFGPVEIQDKLGRTVTLRSAEVSDAKELITYMTVTAQETPYLRYSPGEFRFSQEQEESFIQTIMDSPTSLLLMAYIDRTYIGNCSFSGVGTFKKYAHRCDIGIALYQAYCGCGIGTAMLKTLLEIAKDLGYEQAELEVMSKNEGAIALYKKLGFLEFGRFRDNMKYPDGSYDDALWMMKKL